LDSTADINCSLCGKPRERLHATTWGVTGKRLGCNVYYQCRTCTNSGDRNAEKSTLSPCNEKHDKPS
jgi:hypothetical protein